MAMFRNQIPPSSGPSRLWMGRVSWERSPRQLVRMVFMGTLAALWAMMAGVTEGWTAATMSITASRLEVDDKTRTAVFTGQVQVQDGAMQLSADKMTIYYLAPAKGGAGADKANPKFREMKAEGHVNIVMSGKDRYRGSSDVAVYKVTEQVLELIGLNSDAVVEQDKDRLAGERIQIFLKPDRTVDRVMANSGKNGKVSVRITPSGEVLPNTKPAMTMPVNPSAASAPPAQMTLPASSHAGEKKPAEETLGGNVVPKEEP